MFAFNKKAIAFLIFLGVVSSGMPMHGMIRQSMKKFILRRKVSSLSNQGKFVMQRKSFSSNNSGSTNSSKGSEDGGPDFDERTFTIGCASLLAGYFLYLYEGRGIYYSDLSKDEEEVNHSDEHEAEKGAFSKSPKTKPTSVADHKLPFNDSYTNDESLFNKKCTICGDGKLTTCNMKGRICGSKGSCANNCSQCDNIIKKNKRQSWTYKKLDKRSNACKNICKK